MVSLALFLIGCSALSGPAQTEVPAPAPDMTGVWAVTMKYSDGSCPDVTGGSQSAMWTVNQDASGTYIANVQGGEKLTTLWGNVVGNEVSLTGLTDDYPTLMTEWRLAGVGASVTGRALQTRSAKIVRPKAAQPPSSGNSIWGSASGDAEKSTMCSVIWTVTATKQGA